MLRVFRSNHKLQLDIDKCQIRSVIDVLEIDLDSAQRIKNTKSYS